VAIRQGDFVQLAAGYANGGIAGRIYKFIGTEPAPGTTIDLAAQDYTSADWQLVGGKANAVYAYVGAPGSVNLKAQDYGNTSAWRKAAGTAGAIYQFQGTPGTRDLSAQNYATSADWTAVAAGDIELQATENATLTSTALAASAAVGAGFVGVSFSGAGADAKNVILTRTNAFVQGSDLISADDVIVEASDTAQIRADVIALAAAVGAGAFGGAVGIGSSTAQNLIGYQLDGARTPAQVHAYVLDSSIDAHDDVSITATSNATVEAEVDAGSVALAGGAVWPSPPAAPA
jgi:hypothetical protein